MLLPMNDVACAQVQHLETTTDAQGVARYRYADARDTSWLRMYLASPIQSVLPPVPRVEDDGASAETTGHQDSTATRKQSYVTCATHAFEDILRRQFPALDIRAEPIETPGASTTVQIVVHVTDLFGRTSDLVAKYVPDVPYRAYNGPPLAWRNERVRKLMQEGAQLMAAGRIGLSPEVFRLDSEFGYVLQAYIPSSRPSDDVFRTPERQRRIAEMLAEVHDLDLELQSPIDERLYPRLEEYRLDRLEQMGYLSARGAASMADYLAVLDSINRELPRVRAVLHGDLQPGNILEANADGRWYLIDFEHATLSDPMADMAFYLSDTPYSDAVGRALEAYEGTGRDAGAMAYERLCLHILVLQTRGLDKAIRHDKGRMGPRTAAALENMQHGLSLFALAPGVEQSMALRLQHSQAKAVLMALTQAILAGPPSAS